MIHLKYFKGDIFEWRGQFDFPSLTNEREKELGHKIQEGDEKALEELVLQKMSISLKTAARLERRNMPINDLVQEGNLILVEYAGKFNPEICDSFYGFFKNKVRYAMLDYIGNNSRIVRIPLSRQKKIKRLLNEKNLSDRIVINLSYDELKDIGFDYDDILAMVQRYVYLDGFCSFGDGREEVTIGETIVSDQDYELLELHHILDQAISGLSEKEAYVIKVYYGFNGERKTLKQIARDIELSETRVYQIREIALVKLREKVKGLF